MTIYDFCTPHIIDEIKYLIAFFTANAPTMLSATPHLLSDLNDTIVSYRAFCSNRDNNAHFNAISMYETLFSIECELTINNMREMKNPLQLYLYLLSILPAQKAAKRVTKRNNTRGVKARTSAAGPPLTIADKLRAASTRRLSALGRRRAAAQNDNNNNANDSGIGNAVPFGLGGGSKTRKRMRRKHKKTRQSNK